MRLGRIGKWVWHGLQGLAAVVVLAWIVDTYLLPKVGWSLGSVPHTVLGVLDNRWVLGILTGLIGSLIAQSLWARFWPRRGGQVKTANSPAETPPRQPLTFTVPPPPSGSGRVTVTVDYQDGLPTTPDTHRRELYSQARKLTAENKYQEAIALFRQLLGQGGPASEQAALLIQMGNCFLSLSELDEAAGSYREGERRAKEGNDRQGLAAALGNMGLIYQARGDLDQALEHHAQALKIDRDIGYRQGEAAALGNMGLIYQARGDLDQALEHHAQALTIHRDIGHREGEANALGNMGLVYAQRGDLDQALEHFAQALKLHRDIGHRQGEANALGNMGLIYRIRGDLDKALEHHAQALKLHRDIGHREGEAADLGNLGLIYRVRGDLDQALEHLRQAQAIYEAMGAGGEGPDTVRLAIEAIEAARKGQGGTRPSPSNSPFPREGGG